jgi:hypothetical protein
MSMPFGSFVNAGCLQGVFWKKCLFLLPTVCTVLIGRRNRWVPSDFDKWCYRQRFLFWCVLDTKILLLFW